MEVCKAALLPLNQEDGFQAVIFVDTFPISQTQVHTRTYARACGVVYILSAQKEKRERNIKRLSKQKSVILKVELIISTINLLSGVIVILAEIFAKTQNKMSSDLTK